MEKSSNILLEAGRDITVSMQHKLHRKKKKALLHISEALNNCRDHPLVLLAANLSALKSLKETEVSEALQFLAELKNCSFLLTPTCSYVSGLCFTLVQATGSQMQKACALPTHLKAPQTCFKGCIFQVTKHIVMCLDVSQEHSQTLANKIQVC